MTKNLALCMSRAVTLYFLAWVREFGSNREFDLIVSNNDALPVRYVKYLQQNGIYCVERQFAQEQKYDSIVLQPYEGITFSKNVLSEFSFDNVVYFSDCLRNGMYSFPNLDSRTSELVYFGFELHEESFNDNLSSDQKFLKRSIVSFDAIRNTWIDILKLYPEAYSRPIMNKNDFLLVMRHWGSAPHYPFKKENLQVIEKESLVF